MNLIFHQFKENFADENGVLEAITKELVKRKWVDQPFLQGMKERNKLSTVYMGNELALPHSVSFKYDDSIHQPGLFISRFEKPQKWETNEVRFVIAIIAKATNHLELISKIALIFIDEDIIEKLKDASFEEFVKIFKSHL